MPIAGIDVGTSGCKCTVYSNAGSHMSESYREYNSDNNKQRHELDALLVWEKVKEVIAEATAEVEGLKAVCITSFGEAPVLLGSDDKPLMNSILYTDPRGEEQCETLINGIGRERLSKISGLNPHHMYSIAKIMWIKENRADIFKKVKLICLFADYIGYMLSGNAQIDYSLASRTMAFDINNLVWSREVLKSADIQESLFSNAVPTGTSAGRIKRDVAIELGIPEDVMVVTGCHDQVAAAIGCGVSKTGMAVDGTGTVECITPVFEGIPESKSIYKDSYAIVPYVTPGTYVTYAFSFTGGALLKWYRDKIEPLKSLAATELNINPYAMFQRAIGDEPSGLLVLPHFSGAATPYMDGNSRGAIIGLTTETTSLDIFKALMEGVTYEMLLNMEHLQKAGIIINELRATGGGALSPEWLQMKADILNVKIISLGASQSGTLGCIMLAGVASGIYKNLAEAEKVFVKQDKTYTPDKEKNEKYMEYYRQYKGLYQAVKSVISIN